MTTPSFHIRSIPVYGDAILAPMDGVSDWPFRSLCRALGSALSYTEFVKAEDILSRRPAFALHKFTYEETERPIVFQLYGDDPDEILEAALRVRELNPDIIDINMGCPAKTVSNRGAGVGLMRKPEKIAIIFKKLTSALDIPITGKMRLGWENARTYREVARIVEDNGGALIALHARTKEQGYSGLANWDAIAEIKAAVKIPVIGNGDVVRVDDIARMKDHTHCDAVMIGRAAIKNPWIFARQDRDQVSRDQVREMIQHHLQKSIEFYGEEDGQRLFRKYAVHYLQLKTLDREARKQILKKQPNEEFLAVLNELTALMKK
jgi:nifR3 family TIM-barrel protein